MNNGSGVTVVRMRRHGCHPCLPSCFRYMVRWLTTRAVPLPPIRNQDTETHHPADNLRFLRQLVVHGRSRAGSFFCYAAFGGGLFVPVDRGMATPSLAAPLTRVHRCRCA